MKITGNIQFLKGVEWASLEQIFLCRNEIQSIDILDTFQNLLVIDASNNYIEGVNLSLPLLRSLDLMNNYLGTFPKLRNMKNLKNLNLTSN